MARAINPSTLSDEDLARYTKALTIENNRRRDIAAEAALNKRLAFNRMIWEKRKHLVPLMEHSRSSCSDKNPVNGALVDSDTPRCEKCALIVMEEWQIEGLAIDFQLTVRRNRDA